MPESPNSEENLLASVVADSTNLPSIEADVSERFCSEVMKLLEVRAQESFANEEHPDGVAVFVHVDFPRAPLSNPPAEFARVIDLPVSGQSVFGQMFFLSENADNGSTINLPCSQSEILDWLQQNNLQDRPVIIAYGGTKKASFRPNAGGDRVRNMTIRDKPAELSITELKQALSDFYEMNLVTPSQCDGSIWEPGRSSEYVPAKDTEKAIQRILRVAITHHFRGKARAETEDKAPKGRIDIRILAPSAGQAGLAYWSIIELKVVRTYRNAPKGKPRTKISKSKVMDEIAKGYRQANEFTADREVQEGFLEVYDMREDKSENLLAHPTVQSAADKCAVKVNCNVRQMFGTSDEARIAGAA